MSEMFNGKVALTTGGSSGIGRATALAFAREAAKVVVADVNEKGGEETVRAIQQAGGQAMFIRADVSVAAQVEAMVSKCVEAYGRLDCAFNNAGIGTVVPLHELSETDWDSTIDVNLKGVWLCLKYEIAHMMTHGGGAIVNTSSIAGLVGSGILPAYCASKHGVVGLTKSAALRYGSQGIRVNAVCPGYIQTPLLDMLIEHTGDGVARSIAQQALPRTANPEEVAKAVLWLCSDAASFVTGHAMVIDGGYTAR